MKNFPTYDVDNFSVGGGIVYLGPSGATPTIDIGVVRSNSTLTINRAKERVVNGNPLRLSDAVTVEETATFAFTGVEWNLSNLSRVLGAGITSHTNAVETLSFGGESTFDKYAFLFRHVTKAGHTINVKLWKVSGDGGLETRLTEGLHEFSYSFEALHVETDWAGDALGEGRRLFEIERIKGGVSEDVPAVGIHVFKALMDESPLAL